MKNEPIGHVVSAELEIQDKEVVIDVFVSFYGVGTQLQLGLCSICGTHHGHKFLEVK